MSLCPSSLVFSEVHSTKRVEAASASLGEPVVRRVVALALFLMGAKREEIARHLSLPLGTLFSLLTRISRLGLPALEDRRHGHSEFLPTSVEAPPALQVRSTESGVVVDFGGPGKAVTLPTANVLQIKTFLLTLMENGLLKPSQVAETLGYFATHTSRLARELARGDVPALLDKRQGQKQDYRVTPQVKAELVQQFVVDVITRGKTSGETLSAELQERCQILLPARTVRHHLARMGLPAIRNSLPQLLEAVKKTSR